MKNSLKLDFKLGSKPVSIAAGLLAIASLISCFKADNRAKPLATNIAVAAITVLATNETLSKYYEESVNTNFGNVLEKFDNEIKLTTNDLREREKTISEIQSLYKAKKQEFDDTSSELAATREIVEQLKVQTSILTKSLEVEKKKVEAKLAEDDARFILSVEGFRDNLVKTLKEKLLFVFNSLDASINARLNGEYPSSVRTQLETLKIKLGDYYKHHSDAIEDISLEFEPDEMFKAITTNYSRIYEEISALKVKFRNILNIETRLELENAYQAITEYQKNFLPIDHARKILNDGKDSVSEDINKLENHIRDYDSSLDGMYKQNRKELDDLLNEIERKNLELSDLKKPLVWNAATRDDLRVANGIIFYFQNLGIIVDRAYSDYRKHEATVYFHIDRNNRTIPHPEFNEHSDRLMQLLHTLSPIKFSWDEEQGLLKAFFVIAKKEKELKSSPNAGIPTCKSLAGNSSRGFLVTGHPGAGKSSAIKAIAQWLGNEQSMRLALNPHSDDKNSFTEEGFIELNNLDDIYQAIAELDLELKLRGEDKTRRQTLIVACDELGRLLQDEPEGLNVMEILKLAAVEGRKFNVIVLLGNHSGTVAAIKMDGQFRESFYQLFLVGAARYKLNQPNSPTLKPNEIEWIEDAPYPVLVSINGKYQACQHPTHYPYVDFRDSGYPPIGLEKMPQNTVVIGNRTYTLNPKQCPNCGSLKTESKGKNRKRVCNDCGHHF